MKTEKEKMLAGEPYSPADSQLAQERRRARDLCKRYNDSSEEAQEERRQILNDLFAASTDVWIEPPFFCDYGPNVRLGEKVFFNFNCVILDAGRVTIGKNVLIGPAVQIYTATHPLNADERRTGIEGAKAITIGMMSGLAAERFYAPE